jgi:6-phosphogluconolactonase
MRETRVYPDSEALGEAAAGMVMERVREGIAARGRAAVVLSGGSTPRETLKRLVAKVKTGKVPVDRIMWLFGDERWVLPSHGDSNEAMARETLLSPIGAPESTILSWNAGSGEPPQCALIYAEKMKESGFDEAPPDIVLLGLGTDGHTASLFPDATAVLPGGRRLPVSMDLPGKTAAVMRKDGTWRLTLCPSFLSASPLAIFLVAGREKRESLERTLGADPSAPASWIRSERIIFMATRDALEEGPMDAPAGVRFV